MAHELPLRLIRDPLTQAEPADQVARFEALRAEYPQASYAFSRGFFYGSLREDDPVQRSMLLKWLIDKLLECEQESHSLRYA